jgi:hypothetical protein
MPGGIEMIHTRQKDDVEPVCPHCSQVVEELWFRELRGVLGRRYVYFCSRCRKVLGVSHRKGFWMG